MNAKKLAKIEEIYHAVLEVESEERASFLVNACPDDELRREVESLLSFAKVSSSLIDTPPTDFAAEYFSVKKKSEIIGRKIGRYKILSQIGEGGMGEVFLAEDTRLNRRVAIKFIKTEFARDPDQLRRFLREAKTASSLNHPNIITIYEIGKTKKIQFIAAEYIEGKTLRQAVSDGSLTFNEKIDIALQVATALHAAHSAGIFHRDIKPENIMLREDKLVKVLDFGLAKLAQNKNQNGETNLSGNKLQSKIQNPQLTAPGLIMGTAAYVSPEQARLDSIDVRSDVWSLGVVVYEMFAGQKPFKGKTSEEMIVSILESEPAPLDKKVPDELRQIIEKALQKNADQRYQTAQEFLYELESFRKDFSVDSGLIHSTGSELHKNKTSSNKLINSSQQNLPNNTSKKSENQTNNLSNAGYVFTEFKKHKIFSIAFPALILAIFTLIGYFYFAADSKINNSIAVLPFVNENGDSEIEYLSDGISQSLINSLSQLSGVKVIASSSTFKFKGKEFEPEEIARNLGVKYILTGRVSQRGDILQVTAELIDAADKTQIWGEQFNRNKTGISDVETEISQKIADLMRIHPTSPEKQRLVKGRQADSKAYELFLKGKFYQSKGTAETAQMAAEYFNQSLAIDPNYAQAHVALANIYLYIGANGFQNPQEVMPKAAAAAQRALELDENLAEVHLVLAGIKKTEWDWSGAESEYKRASELNPNLAAVYFSYAFFLSTQGRHDEAISTIKQARELDPLKPNINSDIAYIYYFARQYDQANEQYNISLELNPDYGATYYGRGFISAAKGNYAEAIANYKEMLKLSGDHTGVKCYLAFALAKAGYSSEAQAILKQLETGKDYVSSVELAVLYTGLGEQEKAINALERAFAEHDSQIQYLGIDPHFDSLRANQRFAEIMRQVGLQQVN